MAVRGFKLLSWQFGLALLRLENQRFWEDKTYTIRSSVGQGAWSGVILGA